MYDVKYGLIRGTEQGFDVVVAAGQTILAASSKFVKRTGEGTGTVTMATVADTNILGHLEMEAVPNSVNTGSTLGTEVRKCIVDSGAIFRVPILSGTYVVTMKGKRFDLAIAGGTGSKANVQGITLSTYGYGQLVVVGGDLDDQQFCDVQVYQPMQNISITTAGL